MKMKIQVKVHANSSQEKISKLENNVLDVWIKEKPIDGKANAVLEKLLTKYFNAECKVVSGFSSRKKTLEVKKNEL